MKLIIILISALLLSGCGPNTKTPPRLNSSGCEALDEACNAKAMCHPRPVKSVRHEFNGAVIECQ